MKSKNPPEKDLAKEITALRETIVRLERKWSATMQNRWQLALSFLKGAVSALGALAVVVIITPLIVWAMQRISWPPLIQKVVSQVILQIEQVNRQSPRGVGDQ